MRIHVSQRIDRSCNDVFDFIGTQHFDNHPRWDDSIVEIRRLDEGAIGVGSLAAVRRRRASPDEVIEVLEFDPPRRFKAQDNIGPFLVRFTCDIEAIGPTASVLSLSSDTRASGAARLFLPVLRPVFRNQMRKSLDRIKTMVERPGGLQ